MKAQWESREEGSARVSRGHSYIAFAHMKRYTVATVGKGAGEQEPVRLALFLTLASAPLFGRVRIL